MLSCPQVDFTGGFNGFLAAAYNLGDRSVEEAFGSPFDPFMNDQNFVLSVLTLEEFGATGNKVSALTLAQAAVKEMLHFAASFVQTTLFVVTLPGAVPICLPPVFLFVTPAHFCFQYFLWHIVLIVAVVV